MVCFSIHGVLKRATSRWWPGNQPTWAYRTIKSMYIIHCLLPEVGRSPQSTKSSSHWISATCQTRPSNNHYQSFECTKLTSNMTCWWERCLKRCSSIPGATPQITRSRQSPRLERRRQLLPDFEVRPFKPSGGPHRHHYLVPASLPAVAKLEWAISVVRGVQNGFAR